MGESGSEVVRALLSAIDQSVVGRWETDPSFREGLRRIRCASERLAKTEGVQNNGTPPGVSEVGELHLESEARGLPRPTISSTAERSIFWLPCIFRSAHSRIGPPSTGATIIRCMLWGSCVDNFNPAPGSCPQALGGTLSCALPKGERIGPECFSVEARAVGA
jgi:hypothetical protein